MRAAKDPKYSEFLSNCRVGVYDFDYIKSRICGEGHPKSENCKEMLNSVNICSLHKDRKEILKKTLDICFPNQQKFEIKSIDTHENGSIVSLSTTKKFSDT